MATWAEFEAEAPQMAAEGRRLFYQFGIGLGFLATVRPDGGPRLHPICPIVAEGGLYAFIVPSPKCEDLRRDGRYALHSYPPADVDDEFYVTGRVTEVVEAKVRDAVAAAYRGPVHEDDALFTFDLERCLLAKYKQRGDWPPTYTRWVGSGAK
jgi:hypothetical protein